MLLGFKMCIHPKKSLCDENNWYLVCEARDVIIDRGLLFTLYTIAPTKAMWIIKLSEDLHVSIKIMNLLSCKLIVF